MEAFVSFLPGYHNFLSQILKSTAILRLKEQAKKEPKPENIKIYILYIHRYISGHK